MSNEQGQFDTPVLMLVFNRPELTKIVLNRILEQRPQKLYVVADGCRDGREDDTLSTEKTRALFSEIPSETQLITLFREENLGCKKSVSDGISWFFRQEERGLIFEDDCLPHTTFFRFASELLEYYKDDKRVTHIGGDNFQFGIKRGFPKDASYYFSYIPHIWGWATWRRTWNLYDLHMKGLAEFEQSRSHRSFGWNRFYYYKYIQHFRKVAQNKIDTWDYQYHFSMLYHNGIAVLPNVNLIENIGFGVHATHTHDEGSVLSRIATDAMQFPLVHPGSYKVDNAADNYTLGLIYGKNWWQRGFRFLKNKYNKLL